MIPLKQAKAKRSGPSITIEAVDERVGPDVIKITDIAEIDFHQRPWPVATTKDGAQYSLLGPVAAE